MGSEVTAKPIEPPPKFLALCLLSLIVHQLASFSCQCTSADPFFAELYATHFIPYWMASGCCVPMLSWQVAQSIGGLLWKFYVHSFLSISQWSPALVGEAEETSWITLALRYNLKCWLLSTVWSVVPAKWLSLCSYHWWLYKVSPYKIILVLIYHCFLVEML